MFGEHIREAKAVMKDWWQDFQPQIQKAQYQQQGNIAGIAYTVNSLNNSNSYNPTQFLGGLQR